MKKPTFPKKVTVKGIPGISATIYRQKHLKGRAEYLSYTVAYSLSGKLRRETYAVLGEAEQAGRDAIKRIDDGQQAILELGNGERDVYRRAKEFLAPCGVDLETACRGYAEARAILNGSGTGPRRRSLTHGIYRRADG